MAPNGALPIVFEMGHPMRGAHQRRTTSTNRIGDLHAVRAPAKSNILNFVGRSAELVALGPTRRRGWVVIRAARQKIASCVRPIARSSASPRCSGCESELTPRHRRGEPATLRIWDSAAKTDLREMAARMPRPTIPDRSCLGHRDRSAAAERCAENRVRSSADRGKPGCCPLSDVPAHLRWLFS